jgi:O-antigen ligase
MTSRIGSRFALPQIASVAMAETRLAGRAVPSILRHLAPIVAWSVATIALGVLVGLAAVVLPPLGAFGIVAVAAVILLWVMPDLPLVSPGLIRKALFIMLIVDLSVPFYYMVQFPGLPWISARRLATFALFTPFLTAIAASSDVRRHILERVRASRLLVICAAGYLAIAALSVLTSAGPTESLSGLIDAILSWYVPFLAVIYIARGTDDILFILKILCVCALFNTAAGLVEFRLQHRFFLDIFPSGIFSALIQNNPTLQALLPSPGDFRNGMFRASSIFVTPLSFGEFEIVAIPIGLFFALHRGSLSEKALGWAVVFAGFLGIVISGSRGGWVGIMLSLAVFVAIWSIRQAMKSKASLAPAISGLVGAIVFATIILLIVGSHSVHDMVLGGAAQSGSSEARYGQWLAAIPFVKSNPITGHGFGLGGYVIQSSIDSYVISLLLETGIPGLMFFTGLLLIPVWCGLRNYLSNSSEAGAAAGAVACSIVAFTANRLVLSQKENHPMIFALLAIAVILNYEYAKNRVPEQLSRKLVEKRAPAERGFVDQSRREGQAASVASLIVAALALFLLLTCVHMFSHLL